MSHRSRLALSLLVALVATTCFADAPPPAPIAVPPGHRLLCELHASGVQVYKAVAGKGGRPEWALDGPLATLTDDKGFAAYHYDGPSWEAADGSKVVRDRAEPVKSAPAPDAARDIPWLLVKVQPAVGDPAGRLTPAVYVQRLDTAGGRAPDAPPPRLGTRVGVPYTATYRFFAAAG